MPQLSDPQQPKGWTPIKDAQDAASLLALAAQALAAPVEPILRSRFGSRYFGVHSFLGFLAVPMWMLLWPGEDPGPLMAFWGISVVMQIAARVESLAMAARGRAVHSRYNGFPRLARLFKRTPEEKLKGGAEPALVILAGVGLLSVSEPLGSFLAASGFSLAVVAGLIEATEKRRALSMHDAWLEQQDQAARFREMQSRRR